MVSTTLTSKSCREYKTLSCTHCDSGSLVHNTSCNQSPCVHQHHGDVSRLHWLPVWSRIHFKINNITFKANAHQQPPSLWNILKVRNVPQGLRSARATFLVHPYAGGFGTHAFANYTTKLWNYLSVLVFCAGSVPAFCKALKTHYFNHPNPKNFNHDDSPRPWPQHHPGIELL